MTFKYKLASGLAAGAMLASIVSTSAFAATHVKVNHNGQNSTNTVKVNKTHTNVVGQLNLAIVGNNVTSTSKTGDVDANHNNGAGDKEVTTGDAKNTTTVNNTVGDNRATVTDCGCGDNTNVTVRHNGQKSTNNVTVNDTSTNLYLQGNVLVAENNVTSTSNTGGVDANHNNGTGDTTVETGDATNTTTVTNSTGNNTLTVN